MPFDAAAQPIIVPSRDADIAAAFEAASELDAHWALANPEKALAALMVDPRPCAALDVLLAA